MQKVIALRKLWLFDIFVQCWSYNTANLFLFYLQHFVQTQTL